MIFNFFRKFVPEQQKVDDYLKVTLDRTFSELQQGLAALTFKDNIDGFYVTLELLAGETTLVQNRLKQQPTGFIVVRQTGVGQLTEDALTPWTLASMSVKNNGAAAVTATLFFLR